MNEANDQDERLLESIRAYVTCGKAYEDLEDLRSAVRSYERAVNLMSRCPSHMKPQVADSFANVVRRMESMAVKVELKERKERGSGGDAFVIGKESKEDAESPKHLREKSQYLSRSNLQLQSSMTRTLTNFNNLRTRKLTSDTDISGNNAELAAEAKSRLLEEERIYKEKQRTQSYEEEKERIKQRMKKRLKRRGKDHRKAGELDRSCDIHNHVTELRGKEDLQRIQFLCFVAVACMDGIGEHGDVASTKLDYPKQIVDIIFNDEEDSTYVNSISGMDELLLVAVAFLNRRILTLKFCADEKYFLAFDFTGVSEFRKWKEGEIDHLMNIRMALMGRAAPLKKKTRKIMETMAKAVDSWDGTSDISVTHETYEELRNNSDVLHSFFNRILNKLYVESTIESFFGKVVRKRPLTFFLSQGIADFYRMNPVEALNMELDVLYEHMIAFENKDTVLSPAHLLHLLALLERIKFLVYDEPGDAGSGESGGSSDDILLKLGVHKLLAKPISVAKDYAERSLRRFRDFRSKDLKDTFAFFLQVRLQTEIILTQKNHKDLRKASEAAEKAIMGYTYVSKIVLMSTEDLIKRLLNSLTSDPLYVNQQAVVCVDGNNLSIRQLHDLIILMKRAAETDANIYNSAVARFLKGNTLMDVTIPYMYEKLKIATETAMRVGATNDLSELHFHSAQLLSKFQDSYKYVLEKAGSDLVDLVPVCKYAWKIYVSNVKADMNQRILNAIKSDAWATFSEEEIFSSSVVDVAALIQRRLVDFSANKANSFDERERRDIIRLVCEKFYFYAEKVFALDETGEKMRIHDMFKMSTSSKDWKQVIIKSGYAGSDKEEEKRKRCVRCNCLSASSQYLEDMCNVLVDAEIGHTVMRESLSERSMQELDRLEEQGEDYEQMISSYVRKIRHLLQERVDDFAFHINGYAVAFMSIFLREFNSPQLGMTLDEIEEKIVQFCQYLYPWISKSLIVRVFDLFMMDLETILIPPVLDKSMRPASFAHVEAINDSLFDVCQLFRFEGDGIEQEELDKRMQRLRQFLSVAGADTETLVQLYQEMCQPETMGRRPIASTFYMVQRDHIVTLLYHRTKYDARARLFIKIHKDLVKKLKKRNNK